MTLISSSELVTFIFKADPGLKSLVSSNKLLVYFSLKQTVRGSGEMAQQFKACVTIAEDLSSSPSTHGGAQPSLTPVPEDPVFSSDLH